MVGLQIRSVCTYALNFSDLANEMLCHILLVSSHGYYNFQVEIGVVTNRDFYIKIACKVQIYGLRRGY